MKHAIELKLRDLFAADSDLDQVQVFFIGEPYTIRQNDYPAVIIFIQDQEPITLETGLWIYKYPGFIACETLIRDQYKVQNRTAIVDSYLTMRDILDAMTDNLEDNLALDNLVSGGETVRTIEVGIKTYGFTERGNTILNRGEVPFSVETQKPRSS